MLYSDIKDSASNIYNKVLVFNRDLAAFYKYELGTTNKSIFDGIFYPKDKISSIQLGVTVDNIAVTLNGESVYLETIFSTESANTIQLLTVDEADNGNIEFSFSSFSDTETFTDWGELYQGAVEFGFDTAGDIMRDSIKAPIIISHLERTEDGFKTNGNNGLELNKPSSCYMQYGWDWADQYIGGTELYRFKRNYVPYGLSDPFDYGVNVITSKNRIRGKGHSLGLKLTSGNGFDCRLLGLGIMFTAANKV